MKASRAEITIHEILQEADLNFKEEYSFEGLNSPNGRIYIYIHINKINEKAYIGQTNNLKERWSRNGSRYKDSPLFYSAIQKYGWDNFFHYVLETVSSREEANEAEKYWIQKLNTCNNGYNLSPGGYSGNENWKRQEYREKMHQILSESRKKTWSNSQFSELQQKKMQQGVSEFWNNPEKREKRILALQGNGNPNSKAVRNLETGKIFNTIKEAAEWAGLNSQGDIGQNCKGKRKSAGTHPVTKEKLHWEYVRKEVVQENEGKPSRDNNT